MIRIQCRKPLVTISLDIKNPNNINNIEVVGECAQALIRQLNGSFGFRHGFSAEACTGFDLTAVLIGNEIEYEVIQGQEILDMPEKEIPEGAVD